MTTKQDRFLELSVLANELRALVNKQVLNDETNSLLLQAATEIRLLSLLSSESPPHLILTDI